MMMSLSFREHCNGKTGSAGCGSASSREKRGWMRRKAFMHTVEGLFAAMLLLAYAGRMFSLPEVASDWESNMLTQQSRELLSVMGKTSLGTLIVENRPEELSLVLSTMLERKAGYAIETDGLLRPVIRAGIMMDETDLTIVETGDCDPAKVDVFTAPKSREDKYKCGEFRGHPFAVGDSIQETFGLNYDTVSIDLTGEVPAKFNDIDEDPATTDDIGPLTKSGIFRMSEADGTRSYEVERIGKDGSTVTFMSVDSAEEMKEKLNSVIINGRETNFSVTALSPEESFSGQDVMIISGAKSLADKAETMESFLSSGGGIVEIREFTKSEDIDDVQKEIFGLEWVADYAAAIGEDRGFSTMAVSPGKSSYEMSKNIYATGWWDSRWHYRTPIKIIDSASEGSQGATNRVVNATIRAGSKANRDCSDIRVACYGSEVSSGVHKCAESGSAEMASAGIAVLTANITFLVNVSAGGARTCYAYYGNPSASSAEAGYDYSYRDSETSDTLVLGPNDGTTGKLDSCDGAEGNYALDAGEKFFGETVKVKDKAGAQARAGKEKPDWDACSVPASSIDALLGDKEYLSFAAKTPAGTRTCLLAFVSDNGADYSWKRLGCTKDGRAAGFVALPGEIVIDGNGDGDWHYYMYNFKGTGLTSLKSVKFYDDTGGGAGGAGEKWFNIDEMRIQGEPQAVKTLREQRIGETGTAGFSDLGAPNIYSVHESPDYVVAYQNDGVYKVSDHEGDYHEEFVTGAVQPGTISGIPEDAGVVKFSFLGGTVYVSDESEGKYSTMYVDYDDDADVTGDEEGPHYSGMEIRFGPEYYTAYPQLDGSKVLLRLSRKWHIPGAIVNHDGERSRTVWVSDNLATDDDWGLVRAAVMYASGKSDQLIEERQVKPPVSAVKSVLIAGGNEGGGNAYQAYEATLKMWYQN